MLPLTYATSDARFSLLNIVASDALQKYWLHHSLQLAGAFRYWNGASELCCSSGIGQVTARRWPASAS
jgi:hypothetical protein